MRGFPAVFSMILAALPVIVQADDSLKTIKEEKVTFEGVKYRVVKVWPERLEVAWKDL